MFARRIFQLANAAIKYRSLSTDAVTKTIKFISADTSYTGKGKVGDSLLDVMIDNDIPLDGFGACEGTLACCTCHVILPKEYFEKVDRINPPNEEELDLLDLAPDLDDLSRLGCQIKLEKDDPDLIEVKVPSITRDARTI